MSEEALRQILERMASDEEFRQQAKDDFPEASADYDLSSTELVAFGTQDEDALRRLAGMEVAGFAQSFFGTIICTYGCVPTDTAGSGKGCGTGPRGTRCCGTPVSGQCCGTGGNCSVQAIG